MAIDGSKYFFWRQRYISTGNLRAFDLMTRHYAADQKNLGTPVGKRGIRVTPLQHVPVKCTDPDCMGCMFCSGGLFACEVCGSFEGATTTDCPGESMTVEQSDAVYAGRLDYRAAFGWVNAPSPWSGFSSARYIFRESRRSNPRVMPRN